MVCACCSRADVLTPSNKYNVLDYFINNDYISITVVVMCSYHI